MFDFYEKRKLKSILYSKFTALLILIAALFLASSAYERFKTERDMAARRGEQATMLYELESRAAALESRIEDLESERGREMEIRDRFDVKKGNEEVIVIIDEQNPMTQERTPVSAPPRISLFDRIKALFSSF